MSEPLYSYAKLHQKLNFCNYMHLIIISNLSPLQYQCWCSCSYTTSSVSSHSPTIPTIRIETKGALTCHRQVHYFSMQHLKVGWAAPLFLKTSVFVRTQCNTSYQSEPTIDVVPVWEISEQAFEMLSLRWRWLKITERESAELNCWQPESKYISRSSNWLLFLLDIKELNC